MEDVSFVLKEADGTEVEIRTCHQVMAKASPYFRAMLGENFKEGIELKNNGSCRIELADTDVKAFTILCDIFHFRGKLVTEKSIELDLSYQLAILIDRYNCFDAIIPWPEQWLQKEFWAKFRYGRYPSISVANLQQTLQAKYVAEHFRWDISTHDRLCQLLPQITLRELSEQPLKDVIERMPQNLRDNIVGTITRGRDEYRSLATEMIAELKELKGCKISHVEFANQQRVFCSSLLYGCAVSALQTYIRKDWEQSHAWELPLGQLEERMNKVADMLDWPVSFERAFSTSYKRDTQGRAEEHNHAECSRKRIVKQRVKEIAKTATMKWQRS